jgi:cytochrome P450
MVRGMKKAEFYEFLVYFYNRPLAALIIELAGLFGKVVYVPGVGYFVNDPDIAKSVLINGKDFPSGAKGGVGYLITQIMGEYALLNMDGIDHTVLKAKLRDLFKPAYVDLLIQDTVARTTEEMRAALLRGEEVDIVKFIHTCTTRMTCKMIGVKVNPEREQAVYGEIFEAAVKMTSYGALLVDHLSPEQVSEAQKSFEVIAGYTRQSYEDTTHSDQSVTQLLRGFGFTFDQVKGLITVLILGGTETISASVPRIVALLIDTGQLSRLRQHPDLMVKTIDEGLRVVSPSAVVLRGIPESVDAGGYHFKKGRRVLVSIYNVLKSKRYYKNPRKFVIDRDQDPRIKYMWFGGGPHACLGFPVVQKLIGTILTALVGLPGELEIQGRKYSRNVVFPTYTRLTVKLSHGSVQK